MQTIILVLTLALSLVVSYPMMSLAQEEPSAEKQIPENIDVPLNFTLKVKGGAEEKNVTEGGKDVTVTLKVQSSEGGSPMDLPLTAKISNDTELQDIQLCGAMKEGKPLCQSLEKFVSEKGQNQSSGVSSNETDNNNGNEGN